MAQSISAWKDREDASQPPGVLEQVGTGGERLGSCRRDSLGSGKRR